MSIVVSVLQIAAMLGVPAAIMKLRETKFIRAIGTIGTSYVAGILVALAVFGLNSAGAGIKLDSDVGEIGSHAAIGVAIPLLLFCADLKEVKKLSKIVLISFSCLIFSVASASTIMFFAYARKISFGAELSGMATGLYTGGTPNLNAIGNILGVPSGTIGLANLSDMLVGGVFYLFILVLCKPLLRKFLTAPAAESYMKEETDFENYEELSFKKTEDKKRLALNVFIAVLVAAASAGIGLLVRYAAGDGNGKMTDYVVPSLMIGATIFGIAGSFVRKIREVKGNNFVGQYLINVFGFGLATSINFDQLRSGFLSFLLLYGAITIGAFLIHSILCKIFKIDVDCAIVTLTAGIYGPAFVPAVAKQIKNDGLTAPGLICGSLGYALGTFLGWGAGALFRLAV